MTLRSDVLAYIPSPPQGVWHIGPIPLRAYALCIILGIVVAIWWGERRWQQRGGREGTVLDVAMFAVPFGLIGGRAYHVATDWRKYFGEGGNPVEALYIWQGGLGIWGAVFLGGIGAWIACRIYRIPLPAFGDAIAPPILLAQAIGRLGNWFNQELYGRETTLPWGLEIYPRFDAAGDPDPMNGISNGVVEKIVHPTFLYELLWNVLVVIALVQLDKRFRIGHGRLFALYVAGYSFGRFFVELMRDDEATLVAGIRINNFTSALVFLAAIAYFVFATKGREAPERLQPGGTTRPWPWQLAALRAAGVAANGPAQPGATASTATDTDGDAKDTPPSDDTAKDASATDSATDSAATDSDSGEAAGSSDDADRAAAVKAASGATAAEKSAADKESAAGESAADTSAADKSAADKSAADKSGSAQSAADQPAADKSGSAKSAADKSAGKSGAGRGNESESTRDNESTSAGTAASATGSAGAGATDRVDSGENDA
ncbi:prolipoprotein diacylglyceryl transferase [Nocardia farcinica]|uniref:prolipoprotein diacylglyceryl transferase n=1 Tax=Nocardia farcinica TaxID=37329 RepID=UPI0018957274|nr:prolipoprotein diacylglyceryl transferase [Nocardia farcinica]MBF6421084.1 prolipoprotein diacylglyceryl transferase [Nocardia farcinica]MBF6432741.1 prolipoprotein diacylglyceryl transferase [Nocardia farcinica]MBF6503345.1 prolipoprotein diacylglyceryl transferase [Nocardia farcinica]